MEAERIIGPLRPGSNRCQCAGCHEFFGSVSAFDRHRVGKPGVDRRCRSEFEMFARGMSRSDAGLWITETRTQRASRSRGVRAQSGDQERPLTPARFAGGVR